MIIQVLKDLKTSSYMWFLSTMGDNTGPKVIYTRHLICLPLMSHFELLRYSIMET